MTPMDWLLDYSDCLMGDNGEWWEQRAMQHQDEISAGEQPGKWFAWRDVRQRETAPQL